MNKFTHTLQFRAALIMLASSLLFACGSGSNSDNTDSTVEPETPPVVTTPISAPEDDTPTQKNILLIISDDQGLDASSQYSLSSDLPNTPTLNALAQTGLVFENAWATPACTTSRASLMTGLYPHNSGVTFVPAVLTSEYQTIAQYLKSNDETANYNTAVFGKWHLAGGRDNTDHPASVGIEHYAGNLFNMDDYFQWDLTVNGETSTNTEYHTSKITDLAIEWIDLQEAPWFAWVAYSAPHSPFHLPPPALHSQDLSGTETDISNSPRGYYLAAIEAMDTEIGRLLDSMDATEKENTLIVFIGDNGTPERVVDPTVYQAGHAKGSLYQGSLAVPLVMSGAGVTRQGERESQVVTITDLFASIAQAAGIEQSTIFDSNSVYPLLSDAQYTLPEYIFTEFESAEVSGYAVRSQSYKLITYQDSQQALFALTDNFDETNNLINSNDQAVVDALTGLQTYADSIYPTSNDDPIDITDAILTRQSDNCADYIASYTSSVDDVNRAVAFNGSLIISINQNTCLFSTNAIPNHDFNDGEQAFPNDVSEQDDLFMITDTPQLANSVTALSLNTDNAILLNGVKVDILAAGCFGVGDGKVGCNDMDTPWRYDPMHGPNGFRVDSHNAHAQPDGTYHYHGSPFALFDESNDKASPVIGFAADGFPIFGSYFEDSSQSIRKARSSYQLKTGARPNTTDSPGGDYDGSFRDDYEFIEDSGDLDQCNGMMVEGNYRYYITDTFPYVIGCFTGTPNASFNK